jgi:hypothetical protein
MRPVHCLPGMRVVRRTGRPRKVRRAPDADEQAYTNQVVKVARSFVARDPVVQSAAELRERDDPTVLDKAMEQLAREQASLAFEKELLLGAGRDIAQICSRRIDAISKLAALVVERSKLGIDTFDPRDPRVQRVVQAFFTAFADAAREVLPPETAERFVGDVLARSEGWEDRL